MVFLSLGIVCVYCCQIIHFLKNPSAFTFLVFFLSVDLFQSVSCQDIPGQPVTDYIPQFGLEFLTVILPKPCKQSAQGPYPYASHTHLLLLNISGHFPLLTKSSATETSVFLFCLLVFVHLKGCKKGTVLFKVMCGFQGVYVCVGYDKILIVLPGLPQNSRLK